MVGSKFTHVTLLSFFFMILVFSTSAMASSPSDETMWFVNFLKANNGRAFCLPPTMTVGDAAKLLAQYSRAHPELHDQITDPQAAQAFSGTYPCLTVDHLTQQAFSASPPRGQQQILVKPQGEYATIDTRLATTTVLKLRDTAGHENDELISDVENNSGNYAPPVLFMLATVLYKQGRSDDAIFWFNAARLRANFDAARCADESAKSGVPELVAQIPIQLRRSQFDDPAKLRDIVHRVVRWDESTPYNYDYRWINLHGMNAMLSGMGNADVAKKPLSLPPDEWDALAQKTRTDYLGSLDSAIKTYEQQKASN
jgi:hypothetical protein